MTSAVLDKPKPGVGDIIVTVSHDALDAPDGIEQRINAIAEQEGFEIRSLSVVLTDHQTVTGLNKTHLSRTYHTDVLAFDLRDNGSASQTTSIDGEIYVDLDSATERAPEFESTFESEVIRYVIHGLLHLMGYSDQDDEAREKMRQRENHYLGLPSNQP